MKIENLDVADGQIKKITSNVKDLSIVLLDWKQQSWHLKFDNILAVENFNIEEEDLVCLTIESNNNFIAKAIKITEEDDALFFFCYSFFTRHAKKPKLRVVATNCEIEAMSLSQS